MKKLLLLAIFLLPVTCFALNAPGGDPWYLYHIQINKDSLPQGLVVSNDTQQARYGGTDTQKVNEVIRLKNTTSTSVIIIFTPPGDPHFLAGTARQKNNFILPTELSNIKLNISSTSELYISKLTAGKMYHWSYLKKIPPGTSGNDFSKTYYEWGWDQAGTEYAVTQDFLMAQGLDTTGVFPPNGSNREIASIRYAGYTRPANALVPEKRNFSFPIFYKGNEVVIRGTISYSLTPNYLAPEWNFSDDPSWSNYRNIFKGSSFWQLEASASLTGLMIILIVASTISRKNKRGRQ